MVVAGGQVDQAEQGKVPLDQARKAVLARERESLGRPCASLVEAAKVGIDQATDPELAAPLLAFLGHLLGIFVGAAPLPGAALEQGEPEEGSCLFGDVASSRGDRVRAPESLARSLVLVRAHQAHSLDACRCHGVRRKGPDQLLELERTLEHAGRHALSVELHHAELREEEREQDEVAAVLDDLSRLPRQPHSRRRPMAMKRRIDTRYDDLRPQSRIGLGLDERLLQKPLRPFQIVIHRLAEPQQDLRTLGTRRQLLEQLLEDRTLSLRVAVREVMAGREQLPAAPDAAAGSGRRQRDGELGEFRCRPRRATRGRSHGSGLQFVGDPRRGPVRAESKMPGALLRVADELREAAMQRSPPTRVELRLDTAPPAGGG